MTNPTTDRRSLADAWLADYGRAKFDALTPSERRGLRLYWQARLVSETGCSRQTADTHVKRALAGTPRPKRGAPYAGEPAKG